MANNMAENKSQGFIALYRSLLDHWVWNDEKKLKWWLYLLLNAAYKDRTIIIKGTLIPLSKGQLFRSLDNLSKEWLTTKKTVATFLKLLQKDNMITTENEKIGTRITICNYEAYQTKGNGDYYDEETPPTPEGKRCLPPNNKDNKETTEQINKEQRVVDFGFVFPEGLSEKRKDLLITWINYKSSRKEKYKSQQSFEALIKKNKNYTDDEFAAMIDNSMANNYAGLFHSGKKTQAQQEQPQEENSWYHDFAMNHYRDWQYKVNMGLIDTMTFDEYLNFRKFDAETQTKIKAHIK